MKRRFDARFPFLVSRALQLPAEPGPTYDPGPPSAQLVMRLHRATEVSVALARAFLDDQPRELWERILRVAETCGETPPNGFHDPQEEDPHLGPIIARILEEAAAQAEREDEERLAEAKHLAAPGQEPYCSRLGTCYRIWRVAKERLRSEQGIEWLTPAEMNPHCVFD